jgi:outer membrane protein OmpA-like peptidoglycan-associated protein
LNRAGFDELRDRLFRGEASEEERHSLYEEALRDQALFDDLAAHGELIEMLADNRAWTVNPLDQGARGQIATRRGGRVRRTWPFIGALGLAASAVIAAGIVILSQRPPEPAAAIHVGLAPPAVPSLSSTSAVLPPESISVVPLGSSGYPAVRTPQMPIAARSSGAPKGATGSPAPGALSSSIGGKSRGSAEEASRPRSLVDTYFDTGSDVIPLSARGALDEAVQLLRSSPSARVLIEADADSTEAASLYEARVLAEVRAMHLKEYLVARGVSEPQINARAVVTQTPQESTADRPRSVGGRVRISVQP